MPLHVKIESFCIALIRICEFNVQSNFKKPAKSIFVVDEEKAGSESD